MNNQDQNFNANQNYAQQSQGGFQQQQQGYQQPQQGFQQQPQQPPMSNNIMDGSFTAEAAGVEFGSSGSEHRNPNIQLVPSGLQIARIYKIIDLGTQAAFKGELKRQLKVYFELPQFQQQFQLDKPDMKPTTISNTFNFFTGSKAGLRKLMQAAISRTLTDDEAKKFDFQSILGQVLTINVKHAPGKNDPNKIYANIDSYATTQNMIIPMEFDNPNVPRNPLTAFYLGRGGMNLQTPNFANLNYYDRKTIIASMEAQEFLQKGGVVFRNDSNAKDNFYPGAVGGAPQAQAAGFTPINNQNQQPNGQFQQQNPNQGFQQQAPVNHAFGQNVQQAMQGQAMQQQPQQGYNQNNQQPNAQQFQQPQNPQGGFQQVVQPTQQNFQQVDNNVVQQPSNQQNYQQGMVQQGYEQPSNPQSNQQGFQNVAPQQGFQQQANPVQTEQEQFSDFMMGNENDDLPF